MARADLLLRIVEAGSRGDRERFRRSVETLIAEEDAKQHHVVAKQLKDALSQMAATDSAGSPFGDFPESLLQNHQPERNFDELVLNKRVTDALLGIAEEQQRVDLLRAHGLEPRHRLLLVGPPGNGKTSVAEALATELFVPLVTVRYEGVVGSYLGETASRLAKVFEHVRSRRCVLFFDEFDAVAKERGDEHETGEIKRVVSSLLLQIDRLPSHVVVVAATNHAELLDRAVWRRFQLRINLPPPSREQIQDFLARFASSRGFALGRSPRTLADHLAGASFGEVEEFGLGLLRRYVLAGPNADPRIIAANQLSDWNLRGDNTW